MIAHDSDCGVCGDSGVVRGDYADDDGYEMEFCTHCQLGQELSAQYREPLDVEPVEEPVQLKRAS